MTTINENSQECVILLHGLARTRLSFNKMAKSLETVGYNVTNVNYPSRKYPIEKLSRQYIESAVSKVRKVNPSRIHFVTHSMGGILVRHYLNNNELAELGNIVMLSPPNQGSEVVDKLGRMPGFYLLNGPAGLQLGTSRQSIPNQLGPVSHSVGVITGNKSINLFLSRLIPGQNDGKVSVERAKVNGMTDFLVVPHSHPFIMNSKEVIRQMKYYLKNAQFSRN